METALERCYRAVPPSTLDELRRSRGSVALYCFRRGCERCSSFSADGRVAFEEDLGPTTTIVPWNVGRAHQRRLAMDAGVDDLPAYVIIPPKKRIHVKTPTI